jgi:hypothetical protein
MPYVLRNALRRRLGVRLEREAAAVLLQVVHLCLCSLVDALGQETERQPAAVLPQAVQFISFVVWKRDRFCWVVSLLIVHFAIVLNHAHALGHTSVLSRAPMLNL